MLLEVHIFYEISLEHLPEEKEIPPKSLDFLNSFCYNVTVIKTYAPVAQLDRVSDSDSEGRAFESHQAYQQKPADIATAGHFVLCDHWKNCLLQFIGS